MSQAIAAAVLEPFIDPLNVWMIRHHELFQGYHYRHHFGRDPRDREHFRDHPAYARIVRFRDDWDQTSFDPDYDTLPLAHFVPLVERVLARPPFGGLPELVDGTAPTNQDDAAALHKPEWNGDPSQGGGQI